MGDAATSRVHRVTVRLEGTGVTRVVDVPDTSTLAFLAVVVEAAMGWDGSRGRTWSVDGQDLPAGAEEQWLAGALVGRDARLRHGDAWWHRVLVAPGRRPSALPYPLLLAAEGACPPEDCPGPGAYRPPDPDRAGLRAATERVAALQGHAGPPAPGAL